MPARYIILFSGYNQRAVLAFLRTLEANGIQNYVIFASSDGDTILKTRYASHVAYIRKIRALDWQELSSAIQDVKQRYGFQEFVIPPSTEALNRYLLDHVRAFEKIGCRMTLVDKALYEMISDKEKFSRFCREKGICVPEEIALPGCWTGKPFVAKPRAYSDKDGSVYAPVLIETEAAYREFIGSCPPGAFYYQKYITGTSVYLLYYFPQAKRGRQAICRFSQENLMQQPYGKSILVARPATYHEQPFARPFEKALLSIGYYGFIMIEVRLCGGKAYMIEANPRFWGPSQLFVDAGVNFFEAYLQEWGFLEHTGSSETPDMTVRYFWHGGTFPWNGTLPVFYNGFEKEYWEQVPALMEYDIYRRADTARLFLECR